MCKVSVIVPIYNVEKYIEKCVRSLFEQTFDDIEYIFVDDATPDNSIEILSELLSVYPNRAINCKIIHHLEGVIKFYLFFTMILSKSDNHVS
jgi:glycosyltransferase involved in cell wall biosynthesis